MAIIPTFSNQVNRPRLPGVRIDEGASPDAYGAGIARGLAQAGNVIGEVVRHEKLQADRTAVTAADDQRQQWMNDALYHPENGAFAKKGVNALGVGETVLADYDKEAQRIAAGLTGKRQQLAFTESSRQGRLALQQQLNRHESEQRSVYQDQADKSRINTAVQTAALAYSDPKVIGEQRQAVDAVLLNQKDRKGWDGPTFDAARQEAYGAMHGNVIERQLADGKLKDARAYLNAVGKDLTADDNFKLDNVITAREKQAEAEAKAGLSVAREEFRQEMADIAGAALSGLPVVIPSRREAVALFGPAKGEKYFAHLQSLQQLSSKVAGFNQMTSKELEALKTDLKPTQQEGAAEQALALREVKPQIDRILAERKADPVGYLSTASPAVAEASQGLASNAEGSGRAYFQAVEAEKARLGIFSTEIFPKDAPPGSTEWQQAALLATNKYRQLPLQASKWIDGAMRSSDPNVTAQAATLFDAVNNLEGAYSNVSTESKTKAAMVSSMLNAGADPERAVQAATDAMKVPEAVRAQRNVEFKKTIQPANKGALNGYIDRDYDPGLLVAQPGAAAKALAGGAALQADFDRQVASYYQSTGDADIARELAWSDLRRVYGPTRVNGENVMTAFPVERFGITPDEVRKEIGAALAAFPQSDGTGADDVTLVADGDTYRQVNAAMSGKRVQPSYRLVTKTGDLVRNSKGTPLRYTLPDQQQLLQRYQEDQVRAAAEGEVAIKEARADRELRLKIQALRRMGK